MTLTSISLLYATFSTLIFFLLLPAQTQTSDIINTLLAALLLISGYILGYFVIEKRARIKQKLVNYCYANERLQQLYRFVYNSEHDIYINRHSGKVWIRKSVRHYFLHNPYITFNKSHTFAVLEQNSNIHSCLHNRSLLRHKKKKLIHGLYALELYDLQRSRYELKLKMRPWQSDSGFILDRIQNHLNNLQSEQKLFFVNHQREGTEAEGFDGWYIDRSHRYIAGERQLEVPVDWLRQCPHAARSLAILLRTCNRVPAQHIRFNTHHQYFYTGSQLSRFFLCERFTWYHQPLVDCSGQLYGFELLVRDTQSRLTPQQVIEITRLHGLDRVMIEKMVSCAIAYLELLNAKGLDQCAIFINCDIRHLTLLEQQLHRQLASHGIPSALNRFCIELTEEASHYNINAHNECLQRLADEGVRLYLDDFTEGNTCIATLFKDYLYGVKLTYSEELNLQKLAQYFNKSGIQSVVIERMETITQIRKSRLPELLDQPVLLQGYGISRPRPKAFFQDTVEALVHFARSVQSAAQSDRKTTTTVIPEPLMEKINRKEYAIISEVLKGQSSPAIARKLKIDYPILSWHMKNIYRKLRVNSRSEIISTLKRGTGADEVHC